MPGLHADTNAVSDTGASALTVGYYANDMAASLTQSVTNANGRIEEHKNVFGLDATGRIDHILTTTNGAEVTTEDYQFGNASDAPTAITTHTAATGGAAASAETTRYVTLGGPGMVAAVDTSGTSYQIQNLRGDTVAIVDTAGVAKSYNETDEYGCPIDAGATQGGRYGYLGSTQRAAGMTGGLTLMGARLYGPISGSFLSADSIRGGNATAYGYPADPVNFADTSGMSLSGAWHAFTSVGKAAWSKAKGAGSWLADKFKAGWDSLKKLPRAAKGLVEWAAGGKLAGKIAEIATRAICAPYNLAQPLCSAGLAAAAAFFIGALSTRFLHKKSWADSIADGAVSGGVAFGQSVADQVIPIGSIPFGSLKGGIKAFGRALCLLAKVPWVQRAKRPRAQGNRLALL